ncbi:MAG: heme-binding domain-containing protein [Edaphobacter sp.]
MARTGFRALGWVIVVLMVGFVGMQFVRPEIGNPPVTAEIQTPVEVKQVLRKSCYDCHSNETKLAWFDQVAPAYWAVASDVKMARAQMNFSEMGKLPEAQQKGFLFEAVNMIQLGAMPLPAYVRLHPEAKVSAEDLAVLRSYLTAPPDAAKAADAAALAVEAASAADTEYDEWVHGKIRTPAVQPEFNGVAFLPDYKSWKAISSTDRFDNHTMRVILGNDVAVKAIAEKRINPWPDGTAFAKVTWMQSAPDAQGSGEDGEVCAGGVDD